MRAVRIADLKAHLSEHLRKAHRGHVVTVLDRDTPIARIVPVDDGGRSLQIRRPAPGSKKPGEVRLPPPLATASDPVALLLEDRTRGR